MRLGIPARKRVAKNSGQGRKVTREMRSHGGRKATTAAEIERRIDLVEKLILRCANANDIRNACTQEFGVGHETADEYARRARARIQGANDQTREERRREAIARIRELIKTAQTNGNTREARQAEALLSEIEGTKQPRQVEVTGAGGGPIQYAIEQELNDALDKLKRTLSADEYRRALEALATGGSSASEAIVAAAAAQSGAGKVDR